MSFLKISQYLQQNTFVGRLFFNKVAGLQVCNCIKKRLQHKRFPVNFAELLLTTYFEEHLRMAAAGRPIQ